MSKRYNGGRLAGLRQNQPSPRCTSGIRSTAATTPNSVRTSTLPGQRNIAGTSQRDHTLAPVRFRGPVVLVEGETDPAVVDGRGWARTAAHEEVLRVAFVGWLVVPVAAVVVMGPVVVVRGGGGRQHPRVLVVHVRVI